MGIQNSVDTKAEFHYVTKYEVADYAAIAAHLGAQLKISRVVESNTSLVRLEWEERDVIHQIVGLIALAGLQKKVSTTRILEMVKSLASDYGFNPDVIVNPALAMENYDAEAVAK